MVEVIDFDSLPDCLKALEEKHRQWINDSLLNDENSTDEEIVENWVENGIPSDAANTAIRYRDQVLSSLSILHLFEPAF